MQEEFGKTITNHLRNVLSFNGSQLPEQAPVILVATVNYVLELQILLLTRFLRGELSSEEDSYSLLPQNSVTTQS